MLARHPGEYGTCFVYTTQREDMITLKRDDVLCHDRAHRHRMLGAYILWPGWAGIDYAAALVQTVRPKGDIRFCSLGWIARMMVCSSCDDHTAYANRGIDSDVDVQMYGTSLRSSSWLVTSQSTTTRPCRGIDIGRNMVFPAPSRGMDPTTLSGHK